MTRRTGSAMHAIRAQRCQFQALDRTAHALAAQCTLAVHNAADSGMGGGI